MNSFVTRNKQDWEELETLVRRARRWLRPLSSGERQRLDQLYRRTAVLLARVRTRTSDQHLIEYLNNLTASAHSVIYLPPRESFLRRIGSFFVEGFPRAIARNGRQHLISAALVIAGGIIGFAAASADPLVAHALWPMDDPRQPGSTPEQLLEHLRGGRDGSGGEKFGFASFLFQHNFRVGILAMATGVLAAVPTVFFMIYNGMFLGVFAAIHHEAGVGSEMWAWILPHGITEFGAIIPCGGVGLILGRAIVRPGAMSRDQSLLLAGREAAKVAVGVFAMLIAAAIIESYVRQSHWSTEARFLFAAGTALFWILYIGWGAYRERTETARATTDSAVAIQ